MRATVGSAPPAQTLAQAFAGRFKTFLPLAAYPVRVGADTDVVDVAVLMSDYNLITVPVVDDERRMIGLITVDDVLEATLPEDWRRRETAQPPDAHRGSPR